jgi:hypothetical protein
MKKHSPVNSVITTLLILFSAGLIISGGCVYVNEDDAAGEIPMTVLWAWERPENLLWLKDKPQIGVAFLAQTIQIEGDEVNIKRRRQPLKVPESTYLIAVTRIETSRSKISPAIPSDNQRKIIAEAIVKSLSLKGVRSVQIDFDAVSSERSFYRSLLTVTRNEIPPAMPLSITALASWCVGDRWLSDLPVDEIVPMVFDMGTDSKSITQLLKDQTDWIEAGCRKSYGLAIYEPVTSPLQPGRRHYYFNNRSWRPRDLKSLQNWKNE